MPLPLALAPVVLAANVPPPLDASVPTSGLMRAAPALAAAEPSLMVTSVEAYDPVGRAQLIAERIPRTWTGSYRPFNGARPLPVRLSLSRVTPLGQMVDLRGELSLEGRVAPVQGNINAKSNQLDLLVLGTALAAVFEPGGEFQGQQGLSLSGWLPDRAIGLGGRLLLNPGPEPAGAGGVIRGLW
jgi:hypothetical protein